MRPAVVKPTALQNAVASAFLGSAKPSRGKPGFLACPMCGKEMAAALFETHRKISHR